jgi:cobalamin biosynthesis protein CobW
MESMFLNFENRCLGYSESSSRKIPLLLVTGFLGAGKTTLLKHLLENKANLKLAILVNEIAEIDIDGQLLNTTEHNAGMGICTRELINGCVCCSASDDLRAAVRAVLDRRDIVVGTIPTVAHRRYCHQP